MPEPATPAPPTTDLAELSVNTLRTLAMDAVQAAESGHPGMPMGCAPIAYLLYREFLRHDPGAPGWWDRDRFVLSAGHGSMLLYAALHLSGYERPTLDEIRRFRQWGSPTAGHPENFLLPGVETTTGPLGQGFANGVGMAMAEAHLAAEFNRPGHDVVDHRVFAIVSDGDLMEGVSSEAASLAGHLQLGNLVYLYDDNHITIDGGTEQTFTEDVRARFDAYGWHTDRVADGADLDGLRRAIRGAIADSRPSLIAVRTVIGYGAPTKQGTAGVHGAPLGEEELAAAKRNLGWPHEEPFTVPDAVYEHMDRRAAGGELRRSWDEQMERYREEHPEPAAELTRRMRGELPDGWREAIAAPEGAAATRAHSGSVLADLAEAVPEVVGGSADLAGSNKTDLEGGGVLGPDEPGGRTIRFGVREHAMAAAVNGMALHGGLRPFGATFLIFTDYARPSLRLSALMGLDTVWVMTHDSVGLGEDGPTHQPIEHLASLRAIPGMTVIRPADGAEVAGAWTAAMEVDGPVLMALTRQSVPDLDGSRDGLLRGGYVLREADGQPDVILIGTGSEVQHCVAAAEQLSADGLAARVVSLPSWELFAAQDEAYRETVLPPEVTARVGVEAGATLGWERWVGDGGTIIGLERFGASAPGDRVMRELGFSAESVAAAARKVLGA